MTNYFYSDASGQKQGPVDDQQLQALATQGMITPESPLETDTGLKSVAGQIPGLKFAASTGLASQLQTLSSKIPWESMKQNGMAFLRWVLPILKKGGEKAMEAAKKGGEMAVDTAKKAAPHIKAQLDKIPVESLKERAIQKIDNFPGGRKRLAAIAGASLLVLIGGWWIMSSSPRTTAVEQASAVLSEASAASLAVNETLAEPPKENIAVAMENDVRNEDEGSVNKSETASAKVSSLEDVILSEILGKESNHYLAHGFANVSFGPQTNLNPDDMVSERYHNKRQETVESITLHRKTSGGSEDMTNGYFFDKKKNLVGYYKSYSTYIDTLPSVEDIRENFGRTNQDIRTVGVGKIIRYTFPHVCVAVKIDNESVTISVIDRKFFERQIRLAIRDRYDAIKWSASVVGSIRGIDRGFDNEMDLKQYMDRLPKWPYNNVAPVNVVRGSVNWIIYAENGEKSIRSTNIETDYFNTYFGKVWSSNLYKTDLASGKRVVGGKETGLEVDIDLCPRIKNDEFFNQTSSLNPLSNTLFSLGYQEINLLLCQEFFPPQDGKYTHHTPSGSDTSLERCTWVTEDGLDVYVFMYPTSDKDRIIISWKSNE